MNSYINQLQKNKRQKALNVTQKKNNDNVTSDFSNQHPSTIAQRQLQEIANNSEQIKQAMQLQTMVNANSNLPIQKKGIEEEELQMKTALIQRKGIEEEESVKGKFALPTQKKENNTGLPDNLKSGIENLSGFSMDDVKVHYNSEKPSQLQAHAYAQGTDIHIASGQEKHLPHEAWHVVQQKQGRVQPTLQMKGNVNVNDDAGLENEADLMGAKALEMAGPDVASQRPSENSGFITHLLSKVGHSIQPLSIQRKVIQLKPLTHEEKAQLDLYFILVNNMHDSLSHSRSLPPLLGEKFYQDVEIAMNLISECLEKNESFGAKAMSVIEWRMDELTKRWNVARFESAKNGDLPMELDQSQLTDAFLREFGIWLVEKKNGGAYSTRTYNTGVSGPTSNGKTVTSITTTKEAFDGMRKAVTQELDNNGCMVFNVSLSFGEGYNATDFIIVEKSNKTGSKEKPKLTFHVWGKYMS